MRHVRAIRVVGLSLLTVVGWRGVGVVVGYAKKQTRAIPLVLLCVACFVLPLYAGPVAIGQFVVLPLLILCLIVRTSESCHRDWWCWRW